MSTSDERSGGCQCGRVRYRLTASPEMLYVCHCSDCQKQSASAFGMSLIMSRRQVDIHQGSECLHSWDTPGDDGNIKRCYYCPDCGTRIMHGSAGRDERVQHQGGIARQYPQPASGRTYLAA